MIEWWRQPFAAYASDVMTPDAPTPALTPKQRRFVEEYLLDMCAGKAAMRAGYSARTANQQGHLLLDHPGIMAAIDAAKIKRSEKVGVDAEWVLQRLVEECEADLADLYDDNNNLKPIEVWPKIWRQGLVAGVEIDALYEGFGKDRVQIGETKKLRLSDRLRRIELIGKHIRVNAFQETVHVTGIDTLSDRMERAHQRLDRQARSGDGAKLIAPIDEPVTIEARANVDQARTMLPGGMQQVTPPVAKPAVSAPRPYRPIMPAAPEPIAWPSFGGRAKSDYDPLT